MRATSAMRVSLPEVSSVISVQGLTKTYASGFAALKKVDLEIQRGEIFALLGPNGAGKTTLINIICGIVNPSTGSVVADGHDIVREFRCRRNSRPTRSRACGRR
jgi:ABC-2 type transport system ATP-binding protein